jgi:hypothetical protein
MDDGPSVFQVAGFEKSQPTIFSTTTRVLGVFNWRIPGAYNDCVGRIQMNFFSSGSACVEKKACSNSAAL